MLIDSKKVIEILNWHLSEQYSKIIEFITDNIEDYSFRMSILEQDDILISLIKVASPEEKEILIKLYCSDVFYQKQTINFNALSEKNKHTLSFYWGEQSPFLNKEMPLFLALAPFVDKENKTTQEFLFSFNYIKNTIYSNKNIIKNIQSNYYDLLKSLFKQNQPELITGIHNGLHMFIDYSTDNQSKAEELRKDCEGYCLKHIELFPLYKNIFNPYVTDYMEKFADIYHDNTSMLERFANNVYTKLSRFDQETSLFTLFKICKKSIFDNFLKQATGCKTLKELNIEYVSVFFNALRAKKDNKIISELINNKTIIPDLYFENTEQTAMQSFLSSFDEAVHLKIKPEITHEEYIKKFLHPPNQVKKEYIDKNETYFSIAAKDNTGFFSSLFEVSFNDLKIELSKIHTTYPNKLYSNLSKKEKFEYLTDFLSRTWFCKTPSYISDYYERKKENILLLEYINKNYYIGKKTNWVLTEYLDILEEAGEKNPFIQEYTEFMSYQLLKKPNSLAIYSYAHQDKTKKTHKYNSYIEQLQRILHHISYNSELINWGAICLQRNPPQEGESNVPKEVEDLIREFLYVGTNNMLNNKTENTDKPNYNQIKSKKI